jgi:hypothetical protein
MMQSLSNAILFISNISASAQLKRMMLEAGYWPKVEMSKF